MTRNAEWIKATEVFDPACPHLIVPAPAEDVETLTEVLGFSLPDDYSEFLQVMGAYDGGLFWNAWAYPDISEVIAYCQRHRPAMAGMERPHCVPFAIGIDFDGLGLRLDPGEVHPPVVLLEGLSPDEEVSENLPAFAWSHEFLFEQAATGRIIVAMSLERRFRIDELDAQVTSDGYSRCWFSRPT